MNDDDMNVWLEETYDPDFDIDWLAGVEDLRKEGETV